MLITVLNEVKQNILGMNGKTGQRSRETEIVKKIQMEIREVKQQYKSVLDRFNNKIEMRENVNEEQWEKKTKKKKKEQTIGTS